MPNTPNIDWIDCADRMRSKRKHCRRLINERWWQDWLKGAWNAVGSWPTLPTYRYDPERGFVRRKARLSFHGLQLTGPQSRGPDFVLNDGDRQVIIVEAKINNTPTIKQMERYEIEYGLCITMLLTHGIPDVKYLPELSRDAKRPIILFEDFLKHIAISNNARYDPMREKLTKELRELEPELKILAKRTNKDVPEWVQTADMKKFETYYQCLDDC